MKSNKLVDDILRAANAQGCRVERTKRNHWKIFIPEGELVVVPGMPSDHRSLRDVIVRLRRAGIIVGGR
jgi:hypothetical protein